MTTESQNSELIDQREDDTENALQGNSIDQEKPENNTNGLVLEQKPEAPATPGNRDGVLKVMRDGLVIFILSLMVTHILQEAGHTRGRFVSGVAEELGVPEAAAPRQLRTRSYSRGGQTFVESPFVDDYPRGNVYRAFAEADRREDVLVMYYAPWDADSRAARQVLVEVAETFHLASSPPDQAVYFAAVNCWLPRSDCVKEFNGASEDVKKSGNKSGQPANPQPKHQMINQFPIFVYYPKNRRGVQYNGPITANHLRRFIESVSHPVTHIVDMSQWHRLRADHGGNGLVGFFHGIYTDPKILKQYQRFLEVAYLRLEMYDPLWPIVGMGIVTCPKLAFKLQINQSSIPVRLTLWNGSSIAYPNKTISAAKSLFKWVQTKLVKPPLTWVDVAGRKSVTLSQSLQTGSSNSILAFMPNPASRTQFNHQYEALLETALRYHDCEGSKSTSTSEAERITLQPNPLLNLLRDSYSNSKTNCLSVQSHCLTKTWFTHLSSKYGWFQKSSYQHHPACTTQAADNSTMSQNLSLKSYTFEDSPGSLHTSPPGDPVIINSQISRTNLKCVNSVGCVESATPFVPDKGIDGLGCRDNRTLNFYALSQDLSLHLGKSIGVTALHSRPSKVAFAIVTLKEETVLSCDNFENLSQCVQAFHANPGGLLRLKATSDVKGVGSEALKMGANTSHIEEITGQNFHETVMDKELNVVLLYQTKSCAFCTAASSAAAAFHSVMRIVTGGGGSGDHSPGSKKRSNGIQSKIKFVTIDAAHNDLPWEFTALSVPTVLFFPASSGNAAESKSDTRVFPSSKTLTTSNLLNFVLANLSPQDRLEFVSDFQVGRQQTTLSDIDILPTHTEL